jgi:hypothetical protein
MKYEIFFICSSSFFILHSSLNFAKQNSLGEPLRAPSARSRRAIRSITPSCAPLVRFVRRGSASIPLAKDASYKI